ncbi:hypothetical protein [Pseudomonas sp. AU10]|uniref:hypothetical protein n=1 Tax=Pseudomonas sp. AU10 TaxID=882697 RepID=UPI00405733F0
MILIVNVEISRLNNLAKQVGSFDDIHAQNTLADGKLIEKKGAGAPCETEMPIPF